MDFKGVDMQRLFSDEMRVGGIKKNTPHKTRQFHGGVAVYERACAVCLAGVA